MTASDLEKIMNCKNVHRGRLSSLKESVSGKYIPEKTPWTLLSEIHYDIALPCATQNEITVDDATRMVSNGVIGVLEGANLPTNVEAQDVFRNANVLYIPGKASNAGGVGVSGFEMSQNAQFSMWTSDVVDKKLQLMMSYIYNQLVEQQGTSTASSANTSYTLEQGANRAGFIKVAKAMKELGWLY
jgi:glutamate dehydrogenase (NADP+)